MRIGIFGGTFNPPHNGHKELAQLFQGRLSLDLLLIMPTRLPPHKQSDMLASGEDRLQMCRLCFDEANMRVSDLELRRSGKSYTVDTLRLLRQQYPDDTLYFLMGSDMLLSFHTWREPDTILSLTHICAAARRHGETQALRAYVQERYPQQADRFIILEHTPIEVSSTEIRRHASDCLPLPVADYIKEKGLYTYAMDE